MDQQMDALAKQIAHAQFAGAAIGNAPGYGGPSYVAGDPAAAPPFTAAAMQLLHAQTQIASEITSRLYDLRDRLFGPQPTGVGQSGAEKSPHASGFTDAYVRQSADLSDLLATANRLSAEIAGRL